MNLLVLGANSEIAQAIARRFAKAEGASLYLASRNMDLLRKKAVDLEIRYGVRATPMHFDAIDFEAHEDFYGSLDPKPDGIILAFGYLGDQETAQHDFSEAQRIIESNFLGAVSIIEAVAGDFEKRGHGFIIGISSVAGERGRQSNYFYGAAKGALTVYLSGLRNRLHKHNVRVMTVLPGFVRTKMTEHLNLNQRLTALPEEVADDVYAAYLKRKDVLYTPWFWRWIMSVLTHLPEAVFKRLSL